MDSGRCRCADQSAIGARGFWTARHYQAHKLDHLACVESKMLFEHLSCHRHSTKLPLAKQLPLLSGDRPLAMRPVAGESMCRNRQYRADPCTQALSQTSVCTAPKTVPVMPCCPPDTSRAAAAPKHPSHAADAASVLAPARASHFWSSGQLSTQQSLPPSHMQTVLSNSCERADVRALAHRDTASHTNGNQVCRDSAANE